VHRHQGLSVLLVAITMLGAQGSVQAQDRKVVELRYTSGAPPKGNPWAMRIERLVAAVDEESKGEMKIQAFLSSQLGSAQDTGPQVARERIDMGGLSTGSVALVVPEMALLSVPGCFESLQQQDCVLDSHLIAIVGALLDKQGAKLLGWGEIGAIDLFGTKPFATPKDLDGVKAVAYASKAQRVTCGSLGATAIPLDRPEWIPAFRTGMAQLVTTPIPHALPSGLTKVAPMATRWAKIDTPAFNLTSTARFDQLRNPHQEALLRAYARSTSAQLRGKVRGFEATLYGMCEKAGAQVVDLSPEQRDLCLKTLAPNQQRIADQIGGSAKEVLAAMDNRA